MNSDILVSKEQLLEAVRVALDMGSSLTRFESFARPVLRQFVIDNDPVGRVVEWPTFDESEYPTEETLLKIEQWPLEDHIGLIDFVKKCWKYPERITYIMDTEFKIRFSTGGWSGNESVIHALEKNVMFMSMWWFSSNRGGGHEFIYPRNIHAVSPGEE